MSVQTLSALVTIVVVLAIAAVFFRVWRLAGHREDYAPVISNAYSIRMVAFWALVLIGLPVSIWLLRAVPYDPGPQEPQIVNVTSAQWYWEFDNEDIVAGRPVEFRVSSLDVNHGFGIYNPAGEIVAQVQAMPGYVNKLVYTFETPGTYEIMCLEYCGLAHHDMTLDVEVADASAAIDDSGTADAGAVDGAGESAANDGAADNGATGDGATGDGATPAAGEGGSNG